MNLVINDESDSEYAQQMPCSYYSYDELIKACLNIHSIQLHTEELGTVLDALDYVWYHCH